MEKLNINNLSSQRVEIDFDKQIIIVHCLDNNTYEKSYYKSFNELIGYLSIEDKILHIMEFGYKYLE